jgi:hypothetical protein
MPTEYNVLQHANRVQRVATCPSLHCEPPILLHTSAHVGTLLRTALESSGIALPLVEHVRAARQPPLCAPTKADVLREPLLDTSVN